MTTYPTDATLRVSGITRTFWANDKTYQATLILGSNMTNYVSPISGRIQSSIETNVTEVNTNPMAGQAYDINTHKLITNTSKNANYIIIHTPSGDVRIPR